MNDIFDRRADFQIPERPEWVRRLNAEGKILDSENIVPLDASSLIDAARRKTGLTDFGDGDWVEPFHTLIDSLESEARLHLLGRIYTRSDLLIYLESRLQITDWYKRHPEIEQQSVESPLFIVGLGRSGTTILHEVLSQDTQFRAVKKWEALFPCPPPQEANYHTDPRISRAHDLITLQDRIAPDWKAKHAVAGELPVECVEFTPACFGSELFTASFQVPKYEEYLRTYDFRKYYQWHLRVVKLLQWRYPTKRWLFKGPNHLPYLRELLDTYPDAKIVFPTRDPIVAVASIVSVLGTIYSFRTNDPFSSDTYTRWMRVDTTAKILGDVKSLIEQSVLHEGNFASIRYVDFCTDPLSAIENLYSQLSLDFYHQTAESMRSYLNEKPKAVFGKHDYYMGEPQAIARERELLKDFQTYFNVPNEV